MELWIKELPIIQSWWTCTKHMQLTDIKIQLEQQSKNSTCFEKDEESAERAVEFYTGHLAYFTD